MKTNIVIAFLIVLVVAIGAFVFFTQNVEAPQENVQVNISESPDATSPQNTADTSERATVVVSYTDDGFSPTTVTIRRGDTVRFINNSTARMWVASAIHPTHLAYAGTSLSEHCPNAGNTSFDQCTAVDNGGTFEFTFEKAGEWKYHNHIRASKTGSVTVEE